jgi:hypothetical protein
MNGSANKYFALRKVVMVLQEQNSSVENEPKLISVHSENHAWVLLGEPGAGKTEAIKQEADASGGKFLRIAEFIDTDIDDEWKDKTLFLDGLDEVRASGNAMSILQKVVNQLKRLGKPKFRITCRAADWNSVDKLDLEQVSPTPISVLRLLELDEGDIVEILNRNFPVINSALFVEEAKRQGILELMKNPQTLTLFTDAFEGNKFPDSKLKTFEVACEKQLIDVNDRHRIANKNDVVSVDELMSCAGHLFALILLSDTLGITTNNKTSNKQFLQINKIENVDQGIIAKIKDSRLFNLDSNECYVPSHRTIAEFLAAKWLAKQLDDNKLSKKRLFNLMLGGDGGVVASLRGLYAWLVVLSNSARDELIMKDPLGVIFYADPKVLSINAKIQLLYALKIQAKKNPNFYWRLQDYSPMGGLVEPELIHHFSDILQSKDYSEEHVVLIRCVLDALKFGDSLVGLAGDIYSIINNVNHPSWVSEPALSTWLKLQEDKQQALTLLDKIIANQLKDDDDQLAGLLLSELYPSIINPESLMRYFHQPKRDNFTGSYVMFWCYELVRIVPNEHTPILLDACAETDNLRDAHHVHYRMSSMVDGILKKGIDLYGDSIIAERLFEWLGIGQDKYGSVYHDNKTWKFLSEWFLIRPLIYQQVLGVVFDQAELADKPGESFYRLFQRLSFITPPKEIGIWHFQQLNRKENKEIINIHLQKIMDVLSYQQEANGLSLLMLEKWANDASKKELLDPFLMCSMDGWQGKSAQDNQNRQARILNEKQARTQWVTPHLARLPSAHSHVGLLNELAHLWSGHFYDVTGNSIEERFNNYSANGFDVLDAVKIGFQKSIEREDLPSVEEIISAHIQGKEFLIGYPCILGMGLRWNNDEASVLSLPDSKLEIAIAFFLVGFSSSNESWFIHLINKKPALVAKIYLQYFGAMLKAKKNDPRLAYELISNSEFNPLTFLVATEVLNIFPLRAKNEQLRIFRRFIYWAYENQQELFYEIVKNKFSVLHSMADSQKVYWLFCANLCDGLITEYEFWQFIGNSQSKLNHLVSFLEASAFNKKLSSRFLGVLIERVSRLANVGHSDKGYVSSAEQLGDKLRGWINQLASIPTEDASNELNSLIQNPKLQKIHALLKTNLYEHDIKKREQQFKFSGFHQVQQVLACKQPANIADLHALVLDVLDDFAKKIRTGHNNPYKIFWKNISSNSPGNQKLENDCRDALLVLLQEKLQRLGIDDVPEAQYFNQTRSDIRLAFGSDMALPIEIKRDSHKELWTACKTQLIDKYSIDPKAQGYGIYLVLWFGSGNVSIKNMNDGGSRPQSASELENRLFSQLDERYKPTITIKVLDVSLPVK